MASGLSNLRVRAENYAYSQVEELRLKVLAAIGDTGSLSGWQGNQLRSKVQVIIDSAFYTLTSDSRSYLQEAWQLGIDRASKEFSKKLDNLPGTSVPSGVEDGMEVLRSAYQHTSAGVSKSLRTMLSRASLSDDATLEQVLSNLRDKSSSGFFDQAKQQVAASLSEECSVLEARAHSLRSRELEAFVSLQKRSGSLSKTKGTKKTEPVTIRVWKHKPLDMVNQPRPNHVEMDGMGVVFDHTQGNIPFRLVGKDGTVYSVMGPKLPPLPIGETAHCGCTVHNVVIWVTDDEKKKLIAQSRSTGGFADSRWK